MTMPATAPAVSTRTDHPFATVQVTPEERAAGALAAERHAAVVASLREHGAAIVDGAVDLDHCESLAAAMAVDLDAAAAKPPSLFVPGHVQHNPPLHGEHLHPDVFANAIAVSVARALLGHAIQLGLYTGNTMLAHTTEAQPVHWDEHQLWPGLTSAPPAHSLIANIPLVDVLVDNGAIELWPGTHLDVRSGDRAGEGLLVPDEWVAARHEEVPPVRVPIPRGALLLRDGRLWHRGTTNTTDRPRPMVAALYTAWWFRPYVIDFFPDAEPVLQASGLGVTPRYRESFDHLVWPPNWGLVPASLD
jgi:hypothetical protein